MTEVLAHVMAGKTHSGRMLLGGSSDCLWIGGGESSIMLSLRSDEGVLEGVGDVTSIWVEKGTLWGRGDISMVSMVGAGEEEGMGGVVHRPQAAEESVIDTSRRMMTKPAMVCLLPVLEGGSRQSPLTS